MLTGTVRVMVLDLQFYVQWQSITLPGLIAPVEEIQSVFDASEEYSDRLLCCINGDAMYFSVRLS